MREQQRNELLERLLIRRDRLLRVVQNAESSNRDHAAQADPTDTAATTYHSEVLSSMSANDWALLHSVDAAVRRIHEGEYGNCVGCGDRIQAKRLEALPWASHCLDCQDLNERAVTVY